MLFPRKGRCYMRYIYRDIYIYDAMKKIEVGTGFH